MRNKPGNIIFARSFGFVLRHRRWFLSFFFSRNMFVIEKFLNSLVKDYGKHQISTDMVIHGIHMFVNY
jgi:hypothetical protein